MAFPQWRALYPICRLACDFFIFGLLLGAIKRLPITWTRRLARGIHRVGNYDPEGPVSPEDLLQSVGQWGTIKYIVGKGLREAYYGYICEGDKVPNVELFRLNDNDVEKCRLLDFMQPGRPLVLNLGSCS